MNKVYIDYKNQTMVISGDISELLKIRYVKLFLKEFDCKVDSDKIAFNGVDNDSFSDLYNEITDILIELDFEMELSQSLQTEFKSQLDENSRFEEFSMKARLVRDNNIDIDEFNEFLGIVKVNLKARKLYRLQYLSAFHLAFAQNACNFSVPGSGKTSIVYAAYSYLRSLDKENPKNISKLLVISPISAFGPWIDEYEECFGTKPDVMRISGEINKEEKENYFYSLNPRELTIVSYHSTINLQKNIEFFLKHNNVLIVLDEAHKIKNTDGGIIAKTINEFAVHAKAKFVLTGTPMPNSYKDLYNIFKFIWPTKEIIKYSLNQLDNMSKINDDERIPDLIDSIKPFFIRIKKSNLDNMPIPVNHPPQIIPMGRVQETIYRFITSKIQYDMEDLLFTDVKKELLKAKLVRLMQAASNPALLISPVKQYEFASNEYEYLVDDENILTMIKDYKQLEIPPKFLACKKLVEEIIERGEKVVIWTTYIDNLKGLYSYFEDFGIKSLMVYGETPVESNENDILSREEIIRIFKNDNTINVLITNPFAVAESISLHKQCHNAIYFERTFNAAHFIQSKDRIHRYGLNKDDIINYYYLISENSIDEKIHEILELKENRMRAVIESEEIPLFYNLNDDAIDDELLLQIMRNYEKYI